MATLEGRLIILATRYGRYPVYDEISGRVGFANRDQDPDIMYESIDDAIRAEATAIRAVVVLEQHEIRSLETQVNMRLTHLGILDD